MSSLLQRNVGNQRLEVIADETNLYSCKLITCTNETNSTEIEALMKHIMGGSATTTQGMAVIASKVLPLQDPLVYDFAVALSK